MNENLVCEEHSEGMIIGLNLLRFKDLLYTQCSNIESAIAVIDSVARKGIEAETVEDCINWDYEIAKELFLAISRLREAEEIVNDQAEIIGAPEIREFKFDKED